MAEPKIHLEILFENCLENEKEFVKIFSEGHFHDPEMSEAIAKLMTNCADDKKIIETLLKMNQGKEDKK